MLHRRYTFKGGIADIEIKESHRLLTVQRDDGIKYHQRVNGDEELSRVLDRLGAKEKYQRR